MKKFLFVVAALVVCLTSCVDDEKYKGISVTNLNYTPELITDDTDVTVSVTVSCFYDVYVTLYYTIDGKTNELTMTTTTVEAEPVKIYQGVIPAQANGTKVSFYVEAANVDEKTTTEAKEYEVGALFANIVLNELNGDTKFIEIYNKGAIDVPLEGMYIVKDDAKTTWTADASVIVPANGYLLLYSEDVVIGGEPQEGYPDNLVFHSGLSGKKSVKIALYMPDGSLRDAFTRGPEPWGTGITNANEKSFAHTPDGADTWLLADPTPGAANPSEGEEIPQE